MGFSKIVGSIGGAFGVNIAVDCCSRSTEFFVGSQITFFWSSNLLNYQCCTQRVEKRFQVV
jgi:hypothetical protein